MKHVNTLLTIPGGFVVIEHAGSPYTYLPIKLHIKPIVGQVEAGWLVVVGPRTVCTMLSDALHDRIHYKSNKIIADLIQLKNEIPDFNYCFIGDDGSAWTYGSVNRETNVPGSQVYINADDHQGVCFGSNGIAEYRSIDGDLMSLIEALAIHLTDGDVESSRSIRIIHRTKDMLSELKLGDIRRKHNVGSDLEDHAVVPTSAFKG